MIKIWKILSIGLICVCLSGCITVDAPLDDSMFGFNPNYNPHLDLPTVPIKPAAPIQVGKFTVGQNKKDAKAMTDKINANFKAATGFRFSGEPIIKVLEKAVRASLEKSNYSITSNSNYILSANLYDVKFPFQSTWSASPTCNIQMQFTLTDKRNNKIVWQQFLNGIGYARTQDPIILAPVFAYQRAVNNLIYNLLSNKNFHYFVSQGQVKNK